MKKIVAVVFALCLLSVSANALVIGGHDYEILKADPYAAVTPDYAPGADLGYFIWANDEGRRSWSVRWSGNTDVMAGADYRFSGSVVISANEFGDFSLWSWDSNDFADSLATSINFFAVANVFEDGFDFTILGDESPSYLGFELNITPLTSLSTAISDQSDLIFIGADLLNPDSGDFAMAAPVPEPATLLLLGSGLVGLAVLRRRQK